MSTDPGMRPPPVDTSWITTEATPAPNPNPERWPRIRAAVFFVLMVGFLGAGIALEFAAPESRAHSTLALATVFFGGLAMSETRWLLGYRAGSWAIALDGRRRSMADPLDRGMFWALATFAACLWAVWTVALIDLIGGEPSAFGPVIGIAVIDLPLTVGLLVGWRTSKRRRESSDGN